MSLGQGDAPPASPVMGADALGRGADALATGTAWDGLGAAASGVAAVLAVATAVGAPASVPGEPLSQDARSRAMLERAKSLAEWRIGAEHFSSGAPPQGNCDAGRVEPDAASSESHPHPLRARHPMLEVVHSRNGVATMRLSPIANKALPRVALLGVALLGTFLLAASIGAPAKDCPDGALRVPKGRFKMGSDSGKKDELPVRTLDMHAYCLDQTEVTVQAYAKCVEAGACSKPSAGEGCNEAKADKANHPVNCVDLSQAEAYCSWAKMRLPTEDEWEYAARGQESRVHPWGDTQVSDQACWNRSQGTCPVDAHTAGKSPFGMLGMAGNVWEWTSSGYSEAYDKERESKRRVIRGGAWNNNFAGMLRAAGRSWNVSGAKTSSLGFRCAK